MKAVGGGSGAPPTLDGRHVVVAGVGKVGRAWSATWSRSEPGDRGRRGRAAVERGRGRARGRGGRRSRRPTPSGATSTRRAPSARPSTRARSPSCAARRSSARPTTSSRRRADAQLLAAGGRAVRARLRRQLRAESSTSPRSSGGYHRERAYARSAEDLRDDDRASSTSPRTTASRPQRRPSGWPRQRIAGAGPAQIRVRRRCRERREARWPDARGRARRSRRPPPARPPHASWASTTTTSSRMYRTHPARPGSSIRRSGASTGWARPRSS